MEKMKAEMERKVKQMQEEAERKKAELMNVKDEGEFKKLAETF